MKKRLIELILVMFSLVILLAPFAAADAGCCCNVTQGLSYNSLNSTIEREDCPSGFSLITPTNRTAGCLEICRQSSTAPPETTPTQCGAIGYTTPPSDLQALPVKGRKEIKLSWSAECPVNYYSISRCKGQGCTGFSLIAQTPPSVFYIDKDDALLWDAIYTYQVIAHYPLSDSNPATASSSTGDIECNGQFASAQFCVSKPYYSQFEAYLKANGYKTTPKGSFTAGFSTAVDNTFYNNYNKAFICDTSNKISSSQVVCTTAQVCVAKEETASCVAKAACSNATSGPFGLYYSTDSCEGAATNQKYCFLDRSPTAVDNCYKCDLQMSCYDYRSKGACERDNCGVSNCEWKDVFPSIGIGVCVNTNYENCPLCTRRGNDFMENYNAYNEIFDQCSEEKAQALSTTQFPCFWQNWAAYGCDNVSCRDYTQTTCGSPSGGIQIYPNNSIQRGSNDPCKIAVCQWDNTLRCHKNADADFDAVDCNPTRADRAACELDYFPPETALISGGEAGRTDYIAIQIMDKLRRADSYSVISSTAAKNYITYMCVWPDNGTECTTFDIKTNNTLLTLNDRRLQDGQKVIKNLSTGKNHIKYYSVDPNNNLGIIKTATISVCDSCQGPYVIESGMRAARKKNNTYYTAIQNPIMDVIFNEPITLTYNKIESGATSVVAQLEKDAGNMNFSFFPQANLAEGSYVLRVNGKDDNDVLMSRDFVLPFVIDMTPGSVSYIINGKKQDYILINISKAQIELNFSEYAVLKNVTIKDYYGENEITSQFVTKDDRLFLATVTVNDGANEINVRAEDFAGNTIASKFTFYVNARPPEIFIVQPSYGVSPVWTFDLAFETVDNVSCRYWYDHKTDSHNLPPPPAFTSLLQFEQTGGSLHTLSNFKGIPQNDTKSYPIYVRCEDTLWGFGDKTFMLYVDNTPPNILSAFAYPDIIKESPFETILKVQTDDDGFCKYSPATADYASMDSTFPNFHTWQFSKVHSQQVTVEQARDYSYNVACENLAGLVSKTSQIKFGVNTSYPFIVTSHTKPFYNSTQVYLALETNKRAYCYYGSSQSAITNCVGACERDYSHLQALTVPGTGKYTYYARCNTGGEASEVSDILTISFVVDMTPPSMVYVNDSSNLPDQPELSYFKDQVRVSWLGEDNETPVNRYFYKLDSIFGTSVINWTLTNKGIDGKPFMITSDSAGKKLNLSEQVTYKFSVIPVNAVDLIGKAMDSDGVTIDSTKVPAACSNRIKDSGETGIDCGGTCPPCAAGASCTNGVDCDSGFCKNGTCAASSCTDKAQNGNETGVDCGGSCLACAVGAACLLDVDCGTGNCEGGVCVSSDACSDGMLTGSESDVDCGGSCPDKCGEGKSCSLELDCVSGARCISGLCTLCDIDNFDCDEEKNCRDDDIDNDGLKNWEDADDDNDGLEDQVDPDDDNDGVADPDDKDCDNDFDNDGIINEQDDDIDGDGLMNWDDPDDDNDGLNDDVDSDDDNDGILDIDEDDDGDGLPNGWEIRNGLNPNDPSDAVTDLDEDGLTALEEFKFDRRLDPNNKDTDGDGWSDKKEIDKGFDPLDPNSHPTSWLWWILILLIIIIVLIVFGYGGYEYYTKVIVPKQKAAAKPAARAPPSRPAAIAAAAAARKLTPEEKKVFEARELKEKQRASRFDKLKSFVPGLKPVSKAQAEKELEKEWATLPEVEDLALEKKISAKAKKKPKITFEKLQELRKGKLSKEKAKALEKLEELTGKKPQPKKAEGEKKSEAEAGKAEEKAEGLAAAKAKLKRDVFKELQMLKPKLEKKMEIPKGARVFEQLAGVALQNFTPEQAEEFLAKLKLLRAGRLSKEEIEELFRKLRITANYYRLHKKELEAELEKATARKSKPKHRK